MRSPAAYQILRDYFYLPTDRAFRRYTIHIGNTLDKESENYKFLKSSCETLDESQKIISLKFDEIQIKQRINFVCNKVVGYSENKENSVATHIQAFMLSSVISKYSEIVCLTPVYRNNAEFLHKKLNEVINYLEDIGFKIICVTADNNRINRNSFEKIIENTSNYFTYSKKYPGSRIYFLFDAPHMLKCIRNNWINQKSTERKFEFVSFTDKNIIESASYKLIENLYMIEKDKNLKSGYGLSYNTIYPNSVQRQNVKLALNIFNEKTSSALRKFKNSDSTCNFIDLIIRFWKLFNINNLTKYINKNDSDSMPFYSPDDPRLIFLEKFADWLDNWKLIKSNNGKLSNETFYSVSFSCRSLVSMIKYILSNRLFKYILTSKFQTDCLESRFGHYRQLSGGSYHIDFTQVLASEKKLRFQNMLKIHNKIIDLNAYEDNPEFNNDESNVYLLYSDLAPLPFSYHYSLEDIDVCIYIAGYILKKLKSENVCSKCLEFYVNREEQVFDSKHYGYIANIDRGKLTYPSNILIQIVCSTNYFFEKYIEIYIEKIAKNLKLENIIELFYEFIIENQIIDEIGECKKHQSCNTVLLRILEIMAKILLNNFTKKINDQIISKKNNIDKPLRYNRESKMYKFNN